VHRALFALMVALSVVGAAACSSGTSTTASGKPPPATAGGAIAPGARIRHVVVIVQENHSFDSYFANFCRDHPDATTRAPVCDGGPATYPSTPTPPVTVDDATTAAHDPNHSQACETAEINGGKMDGYLSAPPVGGTCGAPYNYAYASSDATSPVTYYHQLAAAGALADRFFQPVVGASSANDMYLWTTRFVFPDNTVEPDAIGKQCSTTKNVQRFDDVTDPTSHRNIGSTLSGAGVSWAWYAEGYATMQAAGTTCPSPPADCGAHWQFYPCNFDPSDIPAEYYASSADQPDHLRDYRMLSSDIASGTLPSVVFVKAIGYHSEHPGYGTRLADGISFVRQTVDAVETSAMAGDTLVLVTWDESGGFYDHVAPPAASTVDTQPYGPRIPLLVVGRFARPGAVSHQVMELSSITRFIEWNWLGGKTGQLGGRDQTVANLGSLLDPGLGVPS